MPDSYRDYLAANVLSEGKIVNYRMLSRAQGIHVNLAKQYMYDFYQAQRARKHDSLHATYLLCGRRRYEEKPKPALVDGQINGSYDKVPASSPFPSSAPREEDEKPELDVTAISIVKEEDLEEAKAKLSEITAIHIYSLERATFRNLQSLSDCNREVSLVAAQNEDNADSKRYGVIYNPHVRRRNIKYSHVQRDAPVSQNSEPQVKQEQNDNQPSASTRNASSKPVAEMAFTSRGPSSQPKKNASSNKNSSKPPTLNRDSSDLFKSFAKAKAKPKKEQPSTSELSTNNSKTEQSASEDEPMEDAFETEQDSSASEEESAMDVSEEGKAARQSKLRQMMEDDDEPMKDEQESADEKAASDSKDDDQPSDEKQDKQVQVTVANGRRRGRRRVSKKRTLKDEEGFLVTKEELIWESFSEEEPERKVISSVPSTQGSKKHGNKPGQGKIMSFFSKK